MQPRSRRCDYLRAIRTRCIRIITQQGGISKNQIIPGQARRAITDTCCAIMRHIFSNTTKAYCGELARKSLTGDQRAYARYLGRGLLGGVVRGRTALAFHMSPQNRINRIFRD